MKKFVFAILAVIVSVPAMCFNILPREEYIRKYSAMAVSEMQRSGIPASVTMAQALLESAAGTSRLAVEANNHFGIKCGIGWTGPTTRYDDDASNECFRVYANPAESYRDHSDFLSGSQRYAPLFKIEGNDYKSWAKGLKRCGYATDKAYADKLIDLIELYKLYELDSSVAKEQSVPVENEPAELETPVAVPDVDEVVPVRLSGIGIDASGRKYVYAAEGDSFASIARENGLFKGEVLRFNGESADRALEAGEIVYLSPKRK